MDKYIKLLLEQYSKVILPKFGAIVIENEESGELMFNEYLNYNDGKLDEIIEKESNMELQEAQNMIAKYIRDIQTQIDKGESYDIFGLGSFSKNKDGEIEFTGNLKTGESKKKTASDDSSPSPAKKEEKNEESTKIESKKGDKKEEPKKKESKSSDKKENKYVAPITPTKDASGKPEDKTDKKVKSAKKTDESKKIDKAEKAKKDANVKAEKQKDKQKAQEDKANAKAKARKDKEEAKKAKAKAKEDKKKTKLKDSKPKNSIPKESKEKNPEGKKKRKVGVFGWIIIALIFIAAGGTITTGIYYDEISDYMGWNEFSDKKEMAQNDMAPKGESDDSNSDDSEQVEAKVEEGNISTEEDTEDEQDNVQSVEEPVKEVEPAPTTYTESASNGSYHLIAGGFRERSNAEGKVSELKGKGMEAKIIGRINGLHFVSAKSYNSLSAAKQDINNVRSIAPGAWIYKK